MIRSDNGTNLIGAERELLEVIQQWSGSHIESFILQKSVGISKPQGHQIMAELGDASDLHDGSCRAR